MPLPVVDLQLVGQFDLGRQSLRGIKPDGLESMGWRLGQLESESKMPVFKPLLADDAKTIAKQRARKALAPDQLVKGPYQSQIVMVCGP